MAGKVGLYYPWIHFRDEKWVKLSMLYWRRLKRIVPAYYATQDSPLISEFAEHGLIENVSPDIGLRAPVREFAGFVAENAGRLRARYGIDQVPLEDHTSWGPNPGEDRRAFIHVTKMSEELRWVLTENGLAHLARGGDPDWIGVHPKIAQVYMTSLAEEISRREGLNPVTEGVMDLVGVAGWAPEHLASVLLETPMVEEEARRGGGPPATLAFHAIRSVAPADLNAISGKQILMVREKYGDELIRFQDAIEHAVATAGLSNVTAPNAYQERLEEAYADYVDPQLRQLKRDLKLLKIDTVYSYVSVKTTLPPAVGGAVAEAGVNDPAVTGAAAVLLGVTTVSGAVRNRRKSALTDNPMAYLYRLKNVLQPSGLQARIHAAIEAFRRGRPTSENA